MPVSYRYARFWLSQKGLLPTGKLALVTWYLLGLDLLLFGLQKLLGLFKNSYAESLQGWVTFLAFIVIVFFIVLGIRWLKKRLLWRLRNRLIVTYVFIGVIPVVLLVAMAGALLYLFSGQFANFVVTSELESQMLRMGAANTAIANELAGQLEQGQPPVSKALEGLRKSDPFWVHHQVCAWLGDKTLPLCSATPPFSPPGWELPQNGEIVRDGANLYLRAAITIPVRNSKLTVISSQPLDQDLAERIAHGLGEITLYTTPLEEDQTPPGKTPEAQSRPPAVGYRNGPEGPAIQSGNQALRPVFTAGALPPAKGTTDRQIKFGTPLPVADWHSGRKNSNGAGLGVLTRPSLVYDRLFQTLGDFVEGVELILLFIAIFFAIIELVALYIGTRLSRSVTKAVAQLYSATEHINRGDLTHRIPVQSHDQLASLATSFNSMTASLAELIEEQKQKQRLENELAIAQEVQAQLFPRQTTELESLEVHGFCRPARTVSGDYYDFLAASADRMLLAVGDISGKGISAALLMATIHSAVRAYSMEGMPVLRESVAVGASTGTKMLVGASLQGVEASPGALLALLNHQLFESTPPEKYATLFLGTYDGRARRLTYSNGGHLPPIIMSEDGSIRRLDVGGTVVGLFDNMAYEEASVSLRRGDIFIAYSDGVTEPENDFGEFGEERLIDLLRENRDLPLARISEIVTAAVDDWIGANEQPDDVTLVLARAR
jgi:sigma-B regulation protein RsbU (phosphoserine phosphatase)